MSTLRTYVKLILKEVTENPPIKVTSKILPRIKNTGRSLARIEHTKVLAALGAEPVSEGIIRPQGPFGLFALRQGLVESKNQV